MLKHLQIILCRIRFFSFLGAPRPQGQVCKKNVNNCHCEGAVGPPLADGNLLPFVLKELSIFLGGARRAWPQGARRGNLNFTIQYSMFDIQPYSTSPSQQFSPRHYRGFLPNKNKNNPSPHPRLAPVRLWRMPGAVHAFPLNVSTHHENLQVPRGRADGRPLTYHHFKVYPNFFNRKFTLAFLAKKTIITNHYKLTSVRRSPIYKM